MALETRIIIDRSCAEDKHTACVGTAFDEETDGWVRCACPCHRQFTFNPGLPLGYRLGGRARKEQPEQPAARVGDVVAVAATSLGIIWDDDRAAGDADEFEGLLWYTWAKLGEYGIEPM